MASGIINLNSTREALEGRIVWNSTSNGSVANTSKVYAELQIRRNDGYNTSGTWTGNISVGNKDESYSIYIGNMTDWVTVKTLETTIAHADNGKGSVYIYGYSAGPSGTSMAGHYVQGDKTVTLDTIPRASTITVPNCVIGTATTININRASSTFKHTLKYSFRNLSGTIAEKTEETSLGWIIPPYFYAQISNEQSGEVIVTCETYDGDTKIGESTYKFTVYVDTETSKPNITATIVDNNPITTALTGSPSKLIKYFSRANVETNATAKNNATIKDISVICADGKKVTGQAVASIEGPESGKFTITAEDSRGLSNSITIEKEMVDYIKLAISSVKLERDNTTSSVVRASVQGQFFNGSFGAIQNQLSLKWRYREVGTEAWNSYTDITPTINGNAFSFSGNMGSVYNYQKAYDFEFVAEDKLMPDTNTTIITKGIPILDIGEEDVNINGTLKIFDVEVKPGGGGTTVDVIDNLQSTSTTSALSANQGRILKNILDVKANADNVPTKVSDLTNDSSFINSTDLDNVITTKQLTDKTYVDNQVGTKQDTLVSGTNIKTINNQNILGTGNIEISGGGDSNIYEFDLTLSTLANICKLDSDNTEAEVLSAFGKTKTEIIDLAKAVYDNKKIYFINTTVSHQGCFVNTYFQKSGSTAYPYRAWYWFDTTANQVMLSFGLYVNQITDNVYDAEIKVYTGMGIMLEDIEEKLNEPEKVSTLYPWIGVINATTTKQVQTMLGNVATFFADLRAGKIMAFTDYETEDSDEESTFIYPESTFVSDDLKTAEVIIPYKNIKYKITLVRTTTTGSRLSSFTIQKIGNNVYSSEEQIIGDWFGKPLYRRCFTGTTTSSDLTTIVSSLNVELVDVRGNILDGTNHPNPIDFWQSSSNWCMWFFQDYALYLFYGNNFKNGKQFKIIFEYTKPSD